MAWNIELFFSIKQCETKNQKKKHHNTTKQGFFSLLILWSHAEFYVSERNGF